MVAREISVNCNPEPKDGERAAETAAIVALQSDDRRGAGLRCRQHGPLGSAECSSVDVLIRIVGIRRALLPAIRQGPSAALSATLIEALSREFDYVVKFG